MAVDFGLDPLLARSVVGERTRPRVLALAPSPARHFLRRALPSDRRLSAGQVRLGEAPKPAPLSGALPSPRTCSHFSLTTCFFPLLSCLGLIQTKGIKRLGRGD